MKTHSYLLILVLLLLALPLLQKHSWIIDINFVKLMNYDLNLCFYLDKQGSAFLFTVVCIFSMVYTYSLSYMSNEVNLKRFLAILSLFASSMCLLILSGNLFTSLIGWDGLGISSMFLILFYYSNSALKASTLTFLMNRIGDCFFILTLTSIVLIGENQTFYTSSTYGWLTATLLLLTSITKSAQIPFSTWLPAAMEAPTPVSSLVHSSTLVTAGIFLMYRFSTLWVNSQVASVLLILSISTCFMAALSALVESDLKKLIALSTLSQLGFVMFSLSLELFPQGFMHLLVHAYFKALLFMCAGLLIHSFKSFQSITMMKLNSKQNPLLMFIMSLSVMSMMGLPYLSGFYSKDQVIDTVGIGVWSYLVYFMLIASLVCTVLYSVRMIWYLMSSSNNWHCSSDGDYEMMKPMIPLAIMACMGGSLMTWILMDVQLHLDSSKVWILSLVSISIVSYWKFKSISTSSFLESKWNLEMFNKILSKTFFSFAAKYGHSSDLLGVPELLNKSIKTTLMLLSGNTKQTIKHYSGKLDFLLFLASLLLFL